MAAACPTPPTIPPSCPNPITIISSQNQMIQLTLSRGPGTWSSAASVVSPWVIV